MFYRQRCPSLNKHQQRRLEIRKLAAVIKTRDVEFVLRSFKLHQSLKQHTTKACGEPQKILSNLSQP